MLALQPFKQTMAHAAREGYREASPLTAYKLDDNDGVAKALDFHAAMLNKVDYFLIANHNVQLIELSDLDVIARENHSHIRLNNPDLSAREKNQISKELWREPKHEFMKKWSGSIAVV